MLAATWTIIGMPNRLLDTRDNEVVAPMTRLRVNRSKPMATTLMTGCTLLSVVLTLVFIKVDLDSGALWTCLGLNLLNKFTSMLKYLLHVLTLLFTTNMCLLLPTVAWTVRCIVL